MEGQITAYNSSTGALTVNVDYTSAMAATTPYIVMPGALSGLTLSNDATTPATVLDIAIGGATSDDGLTVMVLTASGFTKNCNAAWAVGSGNGALDSGSALAANTWYHVFLIERVDTFAVDVLISTSATAPTLPTNYTKKRRIWSIKTNASSQILGFIQHGDRCTWKTLPGSSWDFVNQNLTTSPTLFTLNVPPGVRTVALIYASNQVTAGQWIWIKSPETTPGNNYPNLTTFAASSPSAYNYQELAIQTNLNGQVAVSASSTVTGGFQMGVFGFIDNRGK
jgi:hypothetical protein